MTSFRVARRFCGWGTWIQTRINGVRVLYSYQSSCSLLRFENYRSVFHNFIGSVLPSADDLPATVPDMKNHVTPACQEIWDDGLVEQFAIDVR